MSVLIVGADGAIGGALEVALLARGDEVTGTSRRPDTDRLHLDLADVTTLAVPPADVTVICAAMARYADCRAEPDLARRVNVDAPAEIARQVAAQDGHTLLLSTSAIFSGAAPRMPADAPTNPSSAYGRFKADAEEAVLAYAPKASVLRLTKVVGPDMPLLRGWISDLSQDKPVEAFADLTISPLKLEHVIAALLAVIDDQGGGIYQVSGADDISYADIARHLAGPRPELVRPVNAADRGIPAPEIPRFTTLDTGRLAALTGFVPPKAFDVLDAAFLSASRD
jgi:dTDP-4-dehydrorhamnose reductase